MKLNWFSNAPWAPTGYGNQTRLVVPRLQALGHEMSITAFYGLQGGPLTYNGMRVYPVARHPYGQDGIMTAHAVNAGAQAIISLLDLWIINTDLVGLPYFPWFPIDHEPMPRNVLATAKAQRITRGITMSKFGQKMAEREGLETFYVPHCVDTEAFRPGDMREARQYLHLPESAFIVGMVAANKGIPPRKGFFEQIAAFAALKKVHPDALLYLHTDDGTHGGEAVDLVEYCQTLGLRPQTDVLFCDQHLNTLGFSEEYMAALYNALDVKMLVSRGEGFGIPLVEAQACGCPVITGDWTAMGELCFSGWRIPKSEAEPEWSPHFAAFQFRAPVGAIVERLLAAYEMRGNLDYRRRARDGALAYDADKVVDKYWKPTLAAIEALLQEEHKAQPVQIVGAE